MNRSDDFDVVVIGGGPIGGIVAEGTARSGLSTLILEEHGTIGEPVHCAGLISVDGFRRLGIPVEKKLVLNKVRGATIYSSSGEGFTVERRDEQAFVVDRISLDRELVERATSRGSQLLLNAKAESIKIDSKGAFVTTKVKGERGFSKEETLKGKIVVSGEGTRAKLTSELGLEQPNPRMRLYATQFEMSNVKLDREDLVEIHLRKNYAPGFFVWVIPTGRDSARVGLASKYPNSYSSLKHFVYRSNYASTSFAKARIGRVLGGSVLTGGPIAKTFSDRFLAVGDCAGQTKSTTGGGVLTGGICAKIASRIAVESVSSNDFSERFLKKYEETWRGELGREFFAMLQMRRLLNHLPESVLDKLILSARSSGLASLIEERGSIDKQSSLVKSVIRNPKVLFTFLLSFFGIL